MEEACKDYPPGKHSYTIFGLAKDFREELPYNSQLIW